MVWIRWSAAAALGLSALLTLPSIATATEKKISLSVVGFSADGKKMLVDSDDKNWGRSLRLYDVETGKAAKRAKRHEYELADKVASHKRWKRRYKIKDPGVESMKTADEKLAFFSVEKEAQLVIAVTDFQRLGKLTAIELKEDKETETRAQGRLKTIVWSTDRKFMILVVTQKMQGKLESELDSLHFVQFDKQRISWVQPEPGSVGPEAEKRRKGWWPF